ncbi:hypothetical protein DRJ25_02090 [Candidatus Woesearchaeota archaeon]|nr:MAG: hypothetical protein DRJ25_02090 [Candidatus Woesearchaeota archaeon]
MVKKVSIWLILEPLLYSEALHLAEIAKRLNKAHTSVRKQLAVFEKIGLVWKEKKGRQTFYKIKRIPLFIDYVSIIEKERLIKRCQDELVLKEIVEFFHNFSNDIALFGSAVDSLKGAGDVDVLVVGKFNKEKIKIIEEKLNINFHIINVRNLKNVDESLKREVIKKHLIIQGCETWIRWLIS